MNELVTALGLVLVIEGVLYSLFPGHVKTMMEMARSLPEETMRLFGLMAVAAGVTVVWLARLLFAS